MGGMIEYPARRMGSQVLCGWHPGNGRYGCQGILATSPDGVSVALGPGWHEYEPGRWRRTAKAARKDAEGLPVTGPRQRAGWRRTEDGRKLHSMSAITGIPIPAVIECPTCHRPGRVDSGC